MHTVRSVLPHRLQVVHVVEGRDLVHRHLRHAEIVADIRHVVAFYPALFVLNKTQRSHHRRLLLVWRIFFQLAVDFFLNLLG